LELLMDALNYTVLVDLEVFKKLTSLISADGQTHNDVLRELLNLDSIMEVALPEHQFSSLADLLTKPPLTSGFYSRGLLLPNGTALRARYKGKEFRASIDRDHWIDEEGNEHSSPSSAASAVTGNSVNGWRFWEAKRPGDLGWRRLDVIAAKPQ
jgi:hypothetical protein